MNIEQLLHDAAESNLNTDYEIIEQEELTTKTYDCVWTVDGTEKRVRIEQFEDKLPEVSMCTDYTDERSSFGILVMNKRIDANTPEETVTIALDRIFSH